MLVESLLQQNNMDGFYNNDFRHWFEDHCTVFRDSNSTQQVFVEPGIAFQFEFDFYMLLFAKNYPHHMHWFIMRITGFHDPYQVDRNLSVLFVPSEAEISILYNQWASQ